MWRWNVPKTRSGVNIELGGNGGVGLGRNLLRSFKALKGGVFEMMKIPAFFSQGWTRFCDVFIRQSPKNVSFSAGWGWVFRTSKLSPAMQHKLYVNAKPHIIHTLARFPKRTTRLIKL